MLHLRISRSALPRGIFGFCLLGIFVLASSAQGEGGSVLEDTFATETIGERPTEYYIFQDFPSTSPLSDGVVEAEGKTRFLRLRRLEPDPDLPRPTVTRRFPRQDLSSWTQITCSFDICLESEEGTTLQFLLRNGVTGAAGDAVAIYLNPREGVWMLDAERKKHMLPIPALVVGKWYRLTAHLDPVQREAGLSIADLATGERVGELPPVSFFGTQAAYLDRFVIARAQEPVVYDLRFTNLTLSTQ